VKGPATPGGTHGAGRAGTLDPAPSTAPQAWRDNAPFPTTTLIGLDDASEEFTMLYAVVDGRWEMSKDGLTWNLDFELTYVRDR
jgi:hypothetical protein